MKGIIRKSMPVIILSLLLLLLMPTFAFASANTDFVTTAATNFAKLARTMVMVVVLLTFIGVGVGFAVSGQKGRDKIKAKLPWILIGSGIVIFSSEVVSLVKYVIGV
ncbi:MAG: TrbC/VirB2 family protein [Anaerovoracaceae bacterium]